MNRFGNFFFGRRHFGRGIPVTNPGGGGGGPVDPPAPGSEYKLQVDDSTDTTITIAWDYYTATNKNANNLTQVYVDDVLAGSVTGDSDTFQITGLSSGQTVRVKIAPVIGGVPQSESNEILATTERTLGDQWIQGAIRAASPVTTAGETKVFNWATQNKSGVGDVTACSVMIRRYDVPGVQDEDAHKKAYDDIEGRRGYEVVAPIAVAGHTSSDPYEYQWLIPDASEDLEAVYRLFIAPSNSSGQNAIWIPGPVFQEGQNWKPGANITPMWTSTDPGNGTITLVEGGQDVQTFTDWNAAINALNPANITEENDGLRIDGVVRVTSPTRDNYLKVSGDRWRKINIYGGTGPAVDSLRGAVILSGWTDEGGGRYSAPIPSEMIIPAIPGYEGNTVWVDDLPLIRAGLPSRKTDVNTEWIGYAHWGNIYSYQSTADMSEGTFAWDASGGKIWVRLPGGVNPSTYNVEVGVATNLFTGVDSTTPPDQMRNHYRVHNLTLAHSNGSGLIGQVKETVGTGRDGWIIKNCAILGGCTRSLGHYSYDSLIYNVHVDGSQRMAILQQNTGPEFGWTGNPGALKQRTLFMNVSVTAANRGHYFPTNHIGNKRIPGQRYYSEVRGFVGPRTSNAFPAVTMQSMCMGTWFDVPFQNNIVTENLYVDLPFSWYTEIAPEDQMLERVGDWSSINVNNVSISLNDTYRIFIDGTGGTQPGKTQAAFASSSHRVIAMFNTHVDGTTGIFFGGDERTINEPNYSSVATTDNCVMKCNVFRVLPNEWGNFHMQGDGFNLDNLADHNVHLDEFSWYDGYGKSTDRVQAEADGYAANDIVVASGYTFVDEANGDMRITAPLNILDKGAAIASAHPINY